MNSNKELFKRVIHVQEKHITFLDATQKNLAYYLFGKNIDLYKRLTIPRINVQNIMNAFAPQPDNPLQSIVGAFIDELAVSEFRTTVRPYPVEGKEPYDSYANMLEQQLSLTHQKSKRRVLLRSAAFELLSHGYFGIYFDGNRYYFLTAYDLIPGDPNVVEAQAQPFIIRKTQVNKATLETAGVDTKNEQSIHFHEWEQNDDLEMFTLYDVYVNHTKRNVGFTQKGTVVYDQSFSYPKRYPISIANTSEILSSFYTVPVMTQLTQKLIDYQKANASIKESSSSIAKPILTYDSDAGIDVDALHRSLKMGYKHIIVGKNREGDIAFKAPGSLPQYAQQLPDKIEEDIMKHLGLNKTFMGLPNVGARERGALARLLKTSFRKLSSISFVIEEAFQEIDQYIIDYIADHSITFGKQAGINIEEIFSGPVKYIPEERFIAYSTEDSLEKKSFVLNKWKSKLIPTKIALEEMGEKAPSKIMETTREEQKKQQEFAVEMAKDAQTMQVKSILDLVTDRLKGQLDHRFWVTPVADNKALIKIHVSEIDRTAFILNDYSNRIKIESYVEDIPTPLDQIEPTVPETQPVIPAQTEPTTEIPSEPNVNKSVPPVQTPEPVESSSSKIEAPIPSSPTVSKTKPVEMPVPEIFTPKNIEEYLSKSQTIYDAKKYYDLNGMYIVEPHCYDKDTEVLTPNGWIRLFQYKKGTKVLQFNQKTRKANYILPTKFQKFLYNKPLINFKSRYSDLLVTPNHRMLAKYQDVDCTEKVYLAKDLIKKNLKKYFIPRTFLWIGEQCKNHKNIFALEVPSGFKDSKKSRFQTSLKVFLEFFGYWLSEGSLRLTPPKRYWIRLTQMEGKNLERMKKCLTKLNVKWSISDNGKAYNLCFHSKALALYLKKFGHSKDKYIPREFLNLKTEYLRILFDALMLGDGMKRIRRENGIPEEVYTTKSERLKNDFQELVYKLGLSTSIRIDKNTGCYIISVLKCRNKIALTSAKSVNFNGNVYGIEVPSSFLVVRRNDKIVISGNSKWISTGRKLAIVTAVNYSENLDKPFLFTGKDVYGIIILKKMYDSTKFDFNETKRYHMVTDKERKKWWGDKPLYLYLFEFYPFKFPVRYKKTAGLTTFFGHVDIQDNNSDLPEPAKAEEANAQEQENKRTLEKTKGTPVNT